MSSCHRCINFGTAKAKVLLLCLSASGCNGLVHSVNCLITPCLGGCCVCCEESKTGFLSWGLPLPVVHRQDTVLELAAGIWGCWKPRTKWGDGPGPGPSRWSSSSRGVEAVGKVAATVQGRTGDRPACRRAWCRTGCPWPWVGLQIKAPGMSAQGS